MDECKCHVILCCCFGCLLSIVVRRLSVVVEEKVQQYFVVADEAVVVCLLCLKFRRWSVKWSVLSWQWCNVVSAELTERRKTHVQSPNSGRQRKNLNVLRIESEKIQKTKIINYSTFHLFVVRVVSFSATPSFKPQHIKLSHLISIILC